MEVYYFEKDENLTEIAAGWVGRDAILMTGINACIYLLSTIPTYVTIASFALVLGLLWFCRWFLVDRWGRRAILMSGASVVRTFQHASTDLNSRIGSRWQSLWALQVGGSMSMSLRLLKRW